MQGWSGHLHARRECPWPRVGGRVLSGNNMPTIDLNCDLGEATGANDLALLEIVSSANIACGGHAGDADTMAKTVEDAEARRVALGAHPGYPDRANFGRIALNSTLAEIEAFVFDQITALDRIPKPPLTHLSHVKLHGALYHKAMHDEPTALAVARAVKRINPRLLMVAMPSTTALRLWRNEGFTVLIEAFADRTYESDGSLRPRTKPGALITEPTAAATQALTLARNATPENGPHTICIHSDTPGAVEVAQAVHDTLERNGITVRRP